MSFKTLTTTHDNVTANMIKTFLESYGITAIIPDEQTSTITWTWAQAIGGVRVQVEEKDFEDAEKALEEYYKPHEVDDSREDLSEEEIEQNVIDAECLETGEQEEDIDKLTNRAYKVAAAGMIVWPFLHPYSLVLSLRALQYKEPLTKKNRIKTIIAFTISLLSLIGFFLLMLGLILREM